MNKEQVVKVKAKFHYTSWFGAGSEVVRSWNLAYHLAWFRAGSKLVRGWFNPDSIMEFGFNLTQSHTTEAHRWFSCIPVSPMYTPIYQTPISICTAPVLPSAESRRQHSIRDVTNGHVMVQPLLTLEIALHMWGSAATAHTWFPGPTRVLHPKWHLYRFSRFRRAYDHERQTDRPHNSVSGNKPCPI